MKEKLKREWKKVAENIIINVLNIGYFYTFHSNWGLFRFYQRNSKEHDSKEVTNIQLIFLCKFKV